MRAQNARGLAIAALTLFAFVIHAMIPQGWMPVAGSSGGVTLVICTAHGAQPLDLDDQGAPQKERAAATFVCPFAAANAALLAPPHAPTLPAPLTVQAQKPFALAAIPHGAWRLTLYSSRAPPALV